MITIGLASLWLAASCTILALAYRRKLADAWREPVLRAPVLIVESDDWGYGPIEQAEQLDRIAELLSQFHDEVGRHPVMTLGVVLAGPDTDRMRAEGCRNYRRVTLADPRLVPVRDAMVRGVASGVFALQLHGMEHYWPDCLIRAAQTDEDVRNWLTQAGFPATEALPPRLQSRWIDATTLPSKSLPPEQVAAAATEEVNAFTSLFGNPPEVTVPPTFVWTDTVEAAWARAGISVVVTPGRRCESRGPHGEPRAVADAYYNGAVGTLGLSYVVRASYFEPALGHSHQRAVKALEANTRLGRPTLLETHRSNFIGEQAVASHSLNEMKRLFETTRTRFPHVRFMSTAELAQCCHQGSDLVETSTGTRVNYFLRRAAETSRLRKLAWLTGAMIPAWFAYLATRPQATPGSHA